jgi:hypothetical protein
VPEEVAASLTEEVVGDSRGSGSQT